MDQQERERRHDERFQKEVLDALDRIHQVLHDISDASQAIAGQMPRPKAEPVLPPTPDYPVLFSVKALAEVLGLTEGQVRHLEYQPDGPPITRVGKRVYYHRDDVERWLQRQREVRFGDDKRWNATFLPGRIGRNHPASSKPPERIYCDGSGSEPLGASRWPGRGVCRVCRDDVLVNQDGRLRKHQPRWY